jgi:phosphomethylpyrimidine synthase
LCQQQILKNRGVLSPEEIHRLASKTQPENGVKSGEAPACHSDTADDEAARKVQSDQLVSLDTSEVTNVPRHDSVI